MMAHDLELDQQMARSYRKNLKADCSQCFGLCCTALNLIASSDFAINKPAGQPCPNLTETFTCQIHSKLRDKGFKGCTVFDCLGAGQIVSQTTFNGRSWRENPDIAKQMFKVFPIMEQLLEMMAFISEALTCELTPSLRRELTDKLCDLEKFTMLEAEALEKLDLILCRMPVSELLVKTSLHVRSAYARILVKEKNKTTMDDLRGVDWAGKKMRGKDLRTADLRGAWLIAADLRNADLRFADLIGADLRDAQLHGADLSTSLFLTQMQINSAHGDAKTKLPGHVQQPAHWNSK